MTPHTTATGNSLPSRVSIPRLDDAAVIQVHDFIHRVLDIFEARPGDQIRRFHEDLGGQEMLPGMDAEDDLPLQNADINSRIISGQRRQCGTQQVMIGLCGPCGLMGSVGHLAVAQVYRHASAALPGPFLYRQILYTTLWGWLAFSQVPDAFVGRGALAVVASGMYLLWLEWRRC